MITTKKYLWGLFEKSTATANATKKQNTSVLSTLVQEMQDRSRAEIQTWRDALATAENPDNSRLVLLQDLYDNLMTDGHLMANILIRKSAVTSTRFFIQDKNGEEDKEATELFQTEWFFTLLNNMLDSVYKGYTVVELTSIEPIKFTEIPRRNIAPKLQRIYFEAMGEQFINYGMPEFENRILEINTNTFGLLNDIIPQLIWKRNAQQTWADFSEKFGIPLVTVETLETNEKKLNELQNTLDDLGQGANAILPDGSKIQIHDGSTKGDPYSVFSEQIKTANAEISKRIVGGTMIADDGSSRSQSEVHERTLNEKIAEADRKLVEFTVNNKLMPMLIANGLYKFKEGDKFVFDRTQELTVKEHWEMINQAATYYDMDEDVLRKDFGLPIVGAKNLLSQPTGGLTANFQ